MKCVEPCRHLLLILTMRAMRGKQQAARCSNGNGKGNWKQQPKATANCSCHRTLIDPLGYLFVRAPSSNPHIQRSQNSRGRPKWRSMFAQRRTVSSTVGTFEVGNGHKRALAQCWHHGITDDLYTIIQYHTVHACKYMHAFLAFASSSSWSPPSLPRRPLPPEGWKVTYVT